MIYLSVGKNDVGGRKNASSLPEGQVPVSRGSAGGLLTGAGSWLDGAGEGVAADADGNG